VTTIRGIGDSTEELSRSDITEPGTTSRKDSWDEAGKTREEGLWDSDMRKGGIHLNTVVQIAEEHVGRDLEKGSQRRSEFKWA
jgi:hypothetical protein